MSASIVLRMSFQSLATTRSQAEKSRQRIVDRLAKRGLTLSTEVLHERVEGDVEVIKQVSDRILDFLVGERTSSLLLSGASRRRERRVGEFLDGRDDGAGVLADRIANEGVEFPGNLAEISPYSIEINVEIVSRLDERAEAVVREIMSNERRHLQNSISGRIANRTQERERTLSTIVRVISFSARLRDRKALPK